MQQEVTPWWQGAARATLDEATRLQVRELSRAADTDPARHRFDAHTRWKILTLYLSFAAVLLLHSVLPKHVPLDFAFFLALSTFSIAYLRVFMHSQMHWGTGGGRLLEALLDHFISVMYSVPQTGYAYGHRAHHRYDNDYSMDGRPRDLQSTYLGSTDGRPASMVRWILFYVFNYQHVQHARLVFRDGSARDRVWYLVELAAIAAFHALVAWLNFYFYWRVYLPSLLVAWVLSAVVLYMMHAVDARTYVLHPTLNCSSPFFNGFGDNDGYHMEHHLFPNVHPLYLPQVGALIQVVPTQVVADHYGFAGWRWFRATLSGKREQPNINASHTG